MSDTVHVFADVTERRRFRHVFWDDLIPGDEFWYFLRNDPEHPQGPFRMVDRDGCRIANPQGVVLSFEKLRDRLQPVVEAPINEE